jgi:hypothetical protein
VKLDLAARIRHFRVANLRNSWLFRAIRALNWRIPIDDLFVPDLFRGSLSTPAVYDDKRMKNGFNHRNQAG